jgi:hypothetical protein
MPIQYYDIGIPITKETFMKRHHLIVTLIILLLMPLGVSVFAESIDGYYFKLIRSCFPDSRSSDCSQVEEGLSIKQRSKNSFFIYVVTRGDNGHFCKYTGVAHLEDGKYVSSEGSCTIAISISHGIANLSGSEGCSAYCGARATIESSGLKKK